MTRRLLVLSVVFVLALLLGLTLAVPLFLLDRPAQLAAPAGQAPDSGPPAAQLAFEGMVHAVGGGTPALWVVGNFPVTVISTTTIISNGIVAQPGVWARVEAIKAAGLQATTLELQPIPTSDLYDRIGSIDPDLALWRVGNTWISLGPETQVSGAAPEVGHLALVHGVRSASGIDARSITVVSADAEAVYQGTVNLIGPSLWLVDDVTVELTATTVFSGSAAVLGSQALVRGAELGPRRLRAAHIWTLDNTDPYVQFTGWLLRIDGQTAPYIWRVNLIDGPRLRPVFLAVYDDTLVDETAGPAAPGAWLSGHAIYQGNAFYRAQDIAVLPRAPKRQIVEQVMALPATGVAGIWQVGEYRVEVGADTGIVGTPRAGAMVWVSGTPDYANILQAQLIEVLGE